MTVNYINRIWIFVFILCLLMNTGCGARYIRDSQDHFNDAAELENRLIFDSLDNYQAGAIGSITASTLTEYRLALDLVNKAIKENKAKLHEEKLLGTAYMLKAMTLWRISDLEATVPNVNEPINLDETNDDKLSTVSSLARQDLYSLLRLIKSEKNTLTLGTRDNVMLQALPGLIDHDRGRLANSIERAEAFFKSSLSIQKDAMNEAPVDHEIRIYLVLSQLQTLNSLAYAIDRFGEGTPIQRADKLNSEVIEEIKNCYVR